MAHCGNRTEKMGKGIGVRGMDQGEKTKKQEHLGNSAKVVAKTQERRGKETSQDSKAALIHW